MVMHTGSLFAGDGVFILFHCGSSPALWPPFPDVQKVLSKFCKGMALCVTTRMNCQDEKRKHSLRGN